MDGKGTTSDEVRKWRGRIGCTELRWLTLQLYHEHLGKSSVYHPALAPNHRRRIGYNLHGSQVLVESKYEKTIVLQSVELN
jgi:hypothetical protein